MPDTRTAASWAIAPHTAAKHALLGAYLRAWFPILSLGGFNRAIYIDGFAGPGRYTKGEDGSPIIALKALASQTVPLKTAFEFHFVERRGRAMDALKANVAALDAQGLIARTTTIQFHERITFEEAYDRAIGPRLRELAGIPAFALVDPFGWTGLPMRIMADLMHRRSTEVLVNFMFEEINRFLNHPDQPANFDGLFGGPTWRQAYELAGAPRKTLLHDLYREQLRTVAGARYVRSFEMRNDRGASDYFLYFATNNQRGLAKMKEAMWKIDPGGGIQFSDTTDFDQSVLFQPEPDKRLLRKLIEERFSRQRSRVRDVELFVLEDTSFSGAHYKKVLAELEGAGKLSVIDAPPHRRARTFPDLDMVLAFT